MLNKNQTITLTIDSITNEGSGVGRYENIAIFVPGTAPGDIAEVKIVKILKSYCFGIVVNLLTPSPQRTPQDCPVFKQCGGCVLRHIDYKHQLTAKQQWVQDTVHRIAGLDITVNEIVGSPKTDQYRNKAQYPFGTDEKGNTICGFYASRSHNIVPYFDCHLQPKFFSEISKTVCQLIDETGGTIYNEKTNTGLFRHLYIRYGETSGEIMVCLVINGKKLPNPEVFISTLTSKFPRITSLVLNHNTQQTNVILGNKNSVIWGNQTIADTLCSVDFSISPLSFYQVNPQGTQNLYNIAADYANLTDGQLLLDLYCGAGTIGLSIAKKLPNIKLIGIEVIPDAVENAKQNALRNKINNTDFICGDAGQAASHLANQNITPDVIIVDPPRKGCDQPTLDAIVKMQPQKIVMVSCNPGTMARDLKILNQQGYTPTKIQPVDMFPHTKHVECTCLLVKN